MSIVPFLVGVLVLAGEGLEAAQGDVGYLQHQHQDIGQLNILYNRYKVGSFRRTLLSAKPAQRSCRTGSPVYTLHRLEPFSSCVAWLPGTTTPLSELS